MITDLICDLIIEYTAIFPFNFEISTLLIFMDHKIYYAPNSFQSYGDNESNAVLSFLKSTKCHPTEAESQKIVSEFEQAIGQLFGMKYGIFVNSGSSANLLACLGINLGEKDEVITPACTFPTTLSPIIFCGSKVVFVDVAPGHFVPSVDQVMQLVSPKTTAILIPDLVGDEFDFLGLRTALCKLGRSDIRLIEDACDTVRNNSQADIATISFYPSHIISSGGCGGMVLTNDQCIYNQMQSYMNKDSPWDLKAPSFCAAFGIENAKRFPQFKAARLHNFETYYQRLHDCSFYSLPENHNATWLSMCILCKNHRLEIVQELESRNIQTRLCLAGNILRQPFYAKLFPNENPEAFPNTERVFKDALLVGLHQGLSDEDVNYVCDVLLELAKKYE